MWKDNESLRNQHKKVQRKNKRFIFSLIENCSSKTIPYFKPIT